MNRLGLYFTSGPHHTAYCVSKAGTRKVDVRLPGKRNSNSHGARPIHLIITMIKWIRTSRLSIKNSLSHLGAGTEAGSYLRLIDSCITQLKAQGPSRTCTEREEEEEGKAGARPNLLSVSKNKPFRTSLVTVLSKIIPIIAVSTEGGIYIPSVINPKPVPPTPCLNP